MPREIGWSTAQILEWEIKKAKKKASQVPNPTTTTTTTTP